jgi:DNA-directed RNA polymerase
MHFDGGYYTHRSRLISSAGDPHTAARPQDISPAAISALNIIQSTPWRVNTFVLDVMRQAFIDGLVIGDMPSSYEKPLPPRLSEAKWKAMTKEERGAHKASRVAIHSENARAVSLRDAVDGTMRTAEEFRSYERIWFPHRFDFRLRIYPIPEKLSPQGSDISKSLLMFADGKPLGERGVYWLAIRLANTFGMDKLSFADRVKWVEEHEEAIIDTAENPLDNVWWHQADEPWQFLATCKEWAGFVDQGPDFISHLPIPIDGTCNGLQHLSAMGRDLAGAAAVNLTASEERRDVYTDVAQAVAAAVAIDAGRGIPEALAWHGKVDRKVVKRAVMTTPYGVTAHGISSQIINDGFTRGLDGDRLALANYMRARIQDALAGTVRSAVDIMQWLRDSAELVARAGHPLTWPTPAGSLVTQEYRLMTDQRVNTLMGVFHLARPNVKAELDARKQKVSTPPNVIHSFDAAHLQLSVNAMWQNHQVHHLACVHDSFGTHACDTDILSAVLRLKFAEIYREDWMMKIAEHVHETTKVDLPALPAAGSYDPEAILDAPYAFA